MAALATVLSFVVVYRLPNGGSISAASMAPIIFVALTSDLKTALLTSLTYSLVQMMTGFYPPPTQNIISFILVILCDYVVAFGVLGLAGIIAGAFENKKIGAGVASAVVCLMRLACHFISGVTIWSVLAPEGTPVWLYSLTYNSSFMIPEAIITTLVIVLIYNNVKK